jgi:hypothetical protein
MHLQQAQSEYIHTHDLLLYHSHSNSHTECNISLTLTPDLEIHRAFYLEPGHYPYLYKNHQSRPRSMHSNPPTKTALLHASHNQSETRSWDVVQ